MIGLPSININHDVCEGCIYGKMHRLSFPTSSWRAKEPLKLIHVDLWGPIRTPSLGDKRYFLLFINDYSRMVWVYFLEQKSYAFLKFLEFLALVER